MPSGSAESVQLVYDSHLFENDLLTLYNKTLIGTAPYSTLVGIHKDDLSFEIDNHPIKKNLDRRDNKIILIALKLTI
jgi:DNA replication and repair protein RecF